MTPEDKKKWVDALRSGKYVQGHGCLRSDDQYCCLGVALDVLHPEKWRKVQNRWRDVDRDDDQLLSDATIEIIGFSDDQGTLAEMNDDGTPFAEIADWIETNIN